MLDTGKSLSEALIFASTNPQYDDRLIVHWITSSIHENSKLKPGENMLCTEIVPDIQNNFCTQHVLPMSCKKKGFWLRFYHLPATDILIIFVLCANKLLDILKLFKLFINALQIKRDKIWFLGIINHKNQIIYQNQSLHFDSKLCITLNQPGS